MENKTVNYKELYKEQMKINHELRNFLGGSGVEVYAVPFLNEPVKAKVVCSSLNTDDMELVNRFALTIQMALGLISFFKYNGYTVDWS